MKRLLLVLCIVVVAVSVSAIDVGGYLENVTGIASPPVGVDSPLVLVERASAALWLRQPLGGWELNGQGSYTYTPLVPLLFDLDELSLSGVFPASVAGASSIGMTFGRTNYSDPTGFILNHTLDGLKFTTSWPASAFSLAVGTTALVQKPTNGIVLSTLDVLDLADDDKRFAPPRLIATVDFRTLEFLGGQQLTLGAVIQEDLRPTDQLTAVGVTTAAPDAGGRLDTQHLVLGISGSLGPGFFYRTYYSFGSGRSLAFLADANSVTGYSYQYAMILSHMAGAELSYYMPSVLNSRIRFSGLFSSGDADADSYLDGNTEGRSTAFVPLSPSSFSDVFTLQPGNSSHVGVSYSMRPIAGAGDVLQLELSAVSYLRTAGTGPVSAPSVDPASDGTYVGTDIDLSVVAQPFSDLRLVLKGGVFLPNAAVMSTGNEDLDYEVTLQGVLRF